MTSYDQPYALFASVEVGLGSLLHALHVPLRGQFLSLNQVFLLSLATRDDRSPWSAVKISAYAGVMKAGFGQGQRLGPMVAITVQGLLFGLGNAVLRALHLGAILASLWTFIQPYLVLSFLSAGEGTQVIAFFIKLAAKINVPLVPLLLGAILKVLIAVGLSITARRRRRSGQCVAELGVAVDGTTQKGDVGSIFGHGPRTAQCSFYLLLEYRTGSILGTDRANLICSDQQHHWPP